MARARRIPAEVFLSHSHKDRAFVSRVARQLRKNNIKFWYSGRHIIGSKQWHDEIGKALSRCDWFLLFLSPHSVKSPWVKKELLYSLNNARYEERIVPVLFRDCNHGLLSWTLEQIEMVDFRDDFRAGCRALLRVWGLPRRSVARPAKK